jgi:prepilin signal peptidase PulO-like enzyme (type II secretory pathway)
MLMAGILIALKTQKLGLPTILNISPLISIYSAIGIYILCSCIALIFYFKNPFSFGGGDVKLLSAISAFSGFEELAKIIVFSALIFTAYCRVKKLKYAPLAPFIAMSFAAWIFYRIAGAIS